MSKNIVFNSFLRGNYLNKTFNMKITVLTPNRALIEVNEIRKTEIANLYKFYTDIDYVIKFWKYLGIALISKINYEDLNKINDILKSLQNNIQFRKAPYFLRQWRSGFP